MNIKYLLKDDLGNVGQQISLANGESRGVTALFYNDDGTPFVVTMTPTEILVKIFSNINQSSIKYLLSLSKVTSVVCTQLGGIIGVQFVLTAVDSAKMAPNNNGLPMSITFTDSGSDVLELDFQDAFNIVPQLIQT